MSSSGRVFPASLVLTWPEQLLSEAERALYGSPIQLSDRPLAAAPPRSPIQRARLRDSLIRFDAGPLLSYVEHAILATIDPRVESQIPADVLRALTAGSTVIEAERAPWEGGALDGIERVQEAMRAHLEAPTAIPHEDLAFYLPWLEEDQGPSAPPVPPDLKAVTSSDLALPAWDPLAALRRRRLKEGDAAPPAPSKEAQEVPEPAPVSIEAEAAVALKIQGLPPLPFLTAALEAIGVDQDEYGFHLRYGRYAPDERLSQVTVGGLRLSEFSKRVTAWLEEHGATKFPLQVIDDGSGELTVHLLE